jgi:ribosomal RNA-processing protein 12
MDDSLEDALGKIRPHVSSKLAHQQAPAALLRALDGALAAQTTERTPTAYFAALLTTLDGALAAGSVPDLDDGAVVPAALYLLALVAPSVPPPVLRAHAGTLLGLLAPLLPPLDAHAPALRSALGVLAALLCALDRAQLEAPPTRQAFGACLARARDARPKVRRRAAELVRAVLAAPPAPLARHPYAPRVAEWTAAALVQAAADPLARGKGKKSAGESDAADGALHVLALLRLVLLKLPPSVRARGPGAYIH